MSKNKAPHKKDKRKTKSDITNSVVNFVFFGKDSLRKREISTKESLATSIFFISSIMNKPQINFKNSKKF